MIYGMSSQMLRLQVLDCAPYSPHGLYSTKQNMSITIEILVLVLHSFKLHTLLHDLFVQRCGRGCSVCYAGNLVHVIVVSWH